MTQTAQSPIEKAPVVEGILTATYWGEDPNDPDIEILCAKIRICCPGCSQASKKPVFHTHGFFLGNPNGDGGHRCSHCDDPKLMPHGYRLKASPGGPHVVDPCVRVVRPSRRLRRLALANRLAGLQKSRSDSGEES